MYGSAYLALRPWGPTPVPFTADAGVPTRVTYVRTYESIASRARINDDELIRLLGEAGRPAGLVRVHGRTMLTSELQPPAERTPAGRT